MIFLLKEKFSSQVAALQAQPECQICYGRSFEEDHAREPPVRVGPIRATGYPVKTSVPSAVGLSMVDDQFTPYTVSLFLIALALGKLGSTRKTGNMMPGQGRPEHCWLGLT
jgi:hypothetical protein